MGTYGANRSGRSPHGNKLPESKRKTHAPGVRFGSALCGSAFPSLAVDYRGKVERDNVTCERCKELMEKAP